MPRLIGVFMARSVARLFSFCAPRIQSLGNGRSSAGHQAVSEWNSQPFWPNDTRISFWSSRGAQTSRSSSTYGFVASTRSASSSKRAIYPLRGPPKIDLADLDCDALMEQVNRLRAGIREHRDSFGHELCWHHPRLWGLLREKTDPQPSVPAWPQFLRGCIQNRESLDRQLPATPRTSGEFQGRR
jgi:hypothetical protein